MIHSLVYIEKPTRTHTGYMLCGFFQSVETRALRSSLEYSASNDKDSLFLAPDPLHHSVCALSNSSS